MTKASSKALMAELQRNKSFMGTCPACQEEFRLSAAPLFSIEDEPPAAGLAAIEVARKAIRERKDELARAKYGGSGEPGKDRRKDRPVIYKFWISVERLPSFVRAGRLSDLFWANRASESGRIVFCRRQVWRGSLDRQAARHKGRGGRWARLVQAHENEGLTQ
jgi:hypothetical protein